MPPFAVFSLPRSRSAWLKHWLGEARGAPVGHDLAIEADTIDGWLEAIWRLGGTCETGAVEAWPIVRRAMPQMRIVTVRRDLGEVVASLIKLGFDPPLDDLERRAEQLGILSREPGVLAVDYPSLPDPRVCARIQEFCLGSPFNWPLWERMDRINIQLDKGARIERLIARHEALEALKAELRLASSRPFVTVGEERWTDIVPECGALFAAHHAEATDGREGPYSLNEALVAEMEAAGLWRVFVARIDGQIAGYCCWSVAVNAESAAPPTMLHGPFFVASEHSRHRLGKRLLDVSRSVLAASGIEVLRLHHTVYGRGARAGKLYESLGAVEHQREYHLRISDGQH